MTTVAEIAAALEAFAPTQTAADWDNVGLLLGDPAAPVERLMTCLTVTPDVAEEAVAERAGLIVSHHPILFRGAKRLVAGKGDGDVVLPLARARVAVYSPHTAFDNCPGGINDLLCRRLGVEDAEPLRPRDGPREYKLAVYVPDGDLAKVSDALFAAGAGVIGKYSECSFRVPGKGTFFGGEGANPTIGKAGRREEADEWRLEVVLPEAKVAGAVRALRQAHSYEEPAYDIYQLKAGLTGGEGRVGDLAEPVTLGELAGRAKKELAAAAVQVVGDLSRAVKKVAVACGAAGEFLVDSVRAKADVFVTGELRFHDALAARAAGVGVIVPGHYATERPAVEELAARLAADFAGLTAWPSRRETDPLGSFEFRV
ncbi:MAG: Nif3-like dinuclear metal center hexameric protein [Gemmataceae bacterium]|nr:Nif3-like dinuclear metal center hexameric protein [Gemmataceae bacterium]